jgi:hypothetical protein
MGVRAVSSYNWRQHNFAEASMTKGMRLLMMVLILIAIVVGMTQCMQKTMRKKKAVQEDGRAPIPLIHLAESARGSGSGS